MTPGFGGFISNFQDLVNRCSMQGPSSTEHRASSTKVDLESKSRKSADRVLVVTRAKERKRVERRKLEKVGGQREWFWLPTTGISFHFLLEQKKLVTSPVHEGAPSWRVHHRNPSRIHSRYWRVTGHTLRSNYTVEDAPAFLVKRLLNRRAGSNA